MNYGSSSANCFITCYKYENICRRKLYWYSCIKNKGIFNTYKDYKQTWDPNTKVFYEIRKELKKEVDDELHKINVIKNTIKWIFKPSIRGDEIIR
jgi:hypothetical protein